MYILIYLIIQRYFQIEIFLQYLVIDLRKNVITLK